MDDNTHEDEVRDAKVDGDDVGVSGTPSFTINGELLFGASYEELSQRIQAALGG
jgi:protein-disulfide isomerase